MNRIITLLALNILIYSSFRAQFEWFVANDLNPSNLNLDFSEYDQKTATFSAQLSNIVYEEELSINSFVSKLNNLYPEAEYKMKFMEDKKTDTQMMIFGNKNFVFLVFRGTYGFHDLMRDGKFRGVRSKIDSTGKSFHPNLPAGHRGFRKSVIRLLDSSLVNLYGEIDNFIINELKKDKNSIPIYLTGHSLGAALSSMIINPLLKKGYNFKGAYHFAPPLAIWDTDANELIHNPKIHDVTYDIINYTDIITRMPGYGRKKLKHIGKFFRVCYPNRDFSNPLIYHEDEEIFYKYLKREKVKPIGALFKDYHRLKFYIAAVSLSVNSIEQIMERSKTLEAKCSCLGCKRYRGD